MLKSENLPHQQIARIVGVGENTLLGYFVQYHTGGIEALKELNFYKPQSALADCRSGLEAYMRDHPPTKVKEAAAVIEKRIGLRRGLSQVRQFMQGLGLRRRKVGSVPAKADPVAQEAFKIQQLERRLQEAQASQRAIFIDAAHFVFAPFLVFLWSFTRRFVRVPCGRQRFNVLGALNPITQKLVMVTNATYINAMSVCALLQQLAQWVQHTITVVLDNARYQKCQPVRELAQRLGIELLYLPAYPPNLNLTERLSGNSSKRSASTTAITRTSPPFAKPSTVVLCTMGGQHASKLRSLLTLRFQTCSQQAALLAA